MEGLHSGVNEYRDRNYSKIVRVHCWVLPTMSVWGRGFVEFSTLKWKDFGMINHCIHSSHLGSTKVPKIILQCSG